MFRARLRRRAAGLLVVGLPAVGLLGFAAGGCGSDDSAASGSDSAELQLVASFYPLQYAVERIGGDRVAVTNLTPAGAEPHDVELTGRDVASLERADLVVYLADFSPAVDEAIATTSATALDVGPFVDLDLQLTPLGDDESDATTDPHFWLDPTRLASAATEIAARLSELDPERAVEFAANLGALTDDLEALDAEYGARLATCRSRDIVTSHNAFGYLAQRYDLTQVGISGLSPDSEPSPADLAAVTEFVRDNNVTTIYFETLASPDLAETLAAEAGASTAVLDPIEGLSDASKGSDYLDIMRSNLANLEQGQGCT